MTEQKFLEEIMLAAFNSGYNDTAYFECLIGKVARITGETQEDIIHQIFGTAQEYAEDIEMCPTIGTLIRAALQLVVDLLCTKYGIDAESFEVYINASDSHIYRNKITGRRLLPDQYTEINNILAEF